MGRWRANWSGAAVIWTTRWLEAGGAGDGRGRLVAASVGPYGATLHDGSEYRGDYGLSVAQLMAWHRPRMAVLAKGRVVLEGEPDALVAGFSGRIFRKSVERPAVASLSGDFTVLSTRLHGGRARVRVLAGVHPGHGFEAAEPELEDIYFAALPSTRSTAAEAA